jgi:glutaredoxin
MGLTLFVSNSCPQAWAVRQILQDYEVEHTLLNIDEDAAAHATLRHLQKGQQRVPTLLLNDGSIFVEPSMPDLYKILNLELDNWD